MIFVGVIVALMELYDIDEQTSLNSGVVTSPFNIPLIE
jgi:hypothetical protein